MTHFSIESSTRSRVSPSPAASPHTTGDHKLLSRPGSWSGVTVSGGYANPMKSYMMSGCAIGA